jgi:uncharacterized membrane protein HdeD (DUF308 family)
MKNRSPVDPSVILFKGVGTWDAIAIAVAVGLMIALELPSSAVWAIGLLTGINLLSTGVSFVVLALAGRRAGQGAPVTA